MLDDDQALSGKLADRLVDRRAIEPVTPAQFTAGSARARPPSSGASWPVSWPGGWAAGCAAAAAGGLVTDPPGSRLTGAPFSRPAGPGRGSRRPGRAGLTRAAWRGPRWRSEE